MKKVFGIFLICFLLGFQAEAKKIKGHIISGNIKTEVTFLIPLTIVSQEPKYEKFQDGVKYLNKYGEKSEIKPLEADEITFDYKGKKIRMLPIKNTHDIGRDWKMDETLFLKLETDGSKLRLFKYFYERTTSSFDMNTNSMNTFTVRENQYIFQKGYQLSELKGWSMKKNMIKYFSDCPVLVKKIKEKN